MDGCYLGVYYDLKFLFIKRMMINQKQSTLLTRDYIDKQIFQIKHSDITIEMNHRQLINIENYSDITKD